MADQRQRRCHRSWTHSRCRCKLYRHRSGKQFSGRIDGPFRGPKGSIVSLWGFRLGQTYLLRRHSDFAQPNCKSLADDFGQRRRRLPDSRILEGGVAYEIARLPGYGGSAKDPYDQGNSVYRCRPAGGSPLLAAGGGPVISNNWRCRSSIDRIHKIRRSGGGSVRLHGVGGPGHRNEGASPILARSGNAAPGRYCG